MKRRLEDLPPINLGKWFPWDKRQEIDGYEKPGVYLLARDETLSLPSEPVDPLDEQIVYIGETSGRKNPRSLWKRWREFESTVYKGEGNHAGGETYFKRYGPDISKLTVAAMSVNPSIKEIRKSLKYIEYKLLLNFILKHKRFPACNRKLEIPADCNEE